MAPPPKNQAEIDARNRWFAYRKGWRDAARDRHDPLIAEHPDGPIKAAYVLGRADFEAATQDAFPALVVFDLAELVAAMARGDK